MKRRKMFKAILSMLLCVILAVSMIPVTVSAGNLHPDGTPKAVSVEAAGEAFTLLKNDGAVLPLSKNVNYPVFGRGSIAHVPGGGGSGDMNIASTSVHESILEGMLEAGLKYDDTTLRIYRANGDPDWYNGGNSNNSNMRAEITLTEAQIAASKASSNSNTALYVIRRASSEGSDRNATSTTEALSGATSANTTQAAQNYQLTTIERTNLNRISAEFDNVVVILNVVGQMDLNWLSDFPNIKSVVLTYAPGSYGMLALGKILSGEVNPSGKLVDTWAKAITDYPARAVTGSTWAVTNPVYAEDIYVGYRYFETFAPDRVLYEFGYGLSYTSFKIDTLNSTANADNITVTVRVQNTGTAAGKEVVQVYHSAPQGVLGKAVKSMAAFAKTDLLAPGESQVLELSFKTNFMNSYDDSGLTGNKSCYVLEAGDYDIFVGNSVKNVTKVNTYNVPALKVTEVCSEAMTPVANTQGTPFNRLSPVANANGGFDKVYTQSPYLENYAAKDAIVQARRDKDLPWVELGGANLGIKFTDVVAAGKDPQTGSYNWGPFMSQIAVTDYIQLIGNNTNMGTTKTVADVTGDSLTELLDRYPNPTTTQATVAYYHALTTTGSAGWFGTRGTQTNNLEQFGIPCMATIDGPAGMRTTQNPGEEGNTWFQCGTTRAAMWNMELAEKIGYQIGLEGIWNDCDVWLAPGMNIHRDPLCGRNFEYYTEDPLLCGSEAAAESKGVQSAGQAVTLKHFAANQQETSRQGGNSQLSERALREVYLKGFEIATKTANPYCIMTSYNRINGSYAASNFDLCTTILRKEWNWNGMVMTDWGAGKDTGANYGNTSGNATMIRAQQDISMTYGGSGGIGSGSANSGTPAIDTWNADLYDRKEIGLTGTMGYYTKDNKLVCTVAQANADTTGILRPIVNGHLSMGELQRSVVNILDMMTKNVYYNTKRWKIGIPEYTYNPSAAFTTVKMGDVASSDKYTVNSGEVVTVAIKVNAGNGLAGGEGLLSYDSNLFTLESVTNANGFILQSKGGNNFNFMAPNGMNATGDIIIGYAVLRAKIVPDDVDTLVLFNITKGYDKNLTLVYPSANAAFVTVLAEPPLRGDVDLDGEVTIIDAILLMQYVSGNTALSSKQLRAADVNADSVVNVGDVIIIMQMCLD